MRMRRCVYHPQSLAIADGSLLLAIVLILLALRYIRYTNAQTKHAPVLDATGHILQVKKTTRRASDQGADTA